MATYDTMSVSDRGCPKRASTAKVRGNWAGMVTSRQKDNGVLDSGHVQVREKPASRLWCVGPCKHVIRIAASGSSFALPVIVLPRSTATRPVQTCLCSLAGSLSVRGEQRVRWRRPDPCSHTEPNMEPNKFLQRAFYPRSCAELGACCFPSCSAGGGVAV